MPHKVYFPTNFRFHEDQWSTHWKDDTTKKTATPCQPVNNILFLKTHKSGTSTLTNILNRYGDKRNLTVALPTKGYDFRWPRPFQISYVNTFGRTPNILNNHARYNKPSMNEIFPKDKTNYITMLREPSAQMESIFNYYGLLAQNFTNKRGNISPLENFLVNATFNMEHMKFHNTRYSNLIKNPALFDLGLDQKYHENVTAVQDYIRQLQQEFQLVLLMEYFDESLVLLKRRFCWEIEDILYFKLNERTNKDKQELTNQAREQIQKWNSGDALLYDVFNQTLWQMIEREGPDFAEDLALFTRKKEAVKKACLQEGNFLTQPFKGKTVQGYEIRSNISGNMKTTCSKMVMNELPYVDYFRKKLTN